MIPLASDTILSDLNVKVVPPFICAEIVAAKPTDVEPILVIKIGFTEPPDATSSVDSLTRIPAGGPPGKNIVENPTGEACPDLVTEVAEPTALISIVFPSFTNASLPLVFVVIPILLARKTGTLNEPTAAKPREGLSAYVTYDGKPSFPASVE